MPMPEQRRAELLSLVATAAPGLAERRVISPATVRRNQRELAKQLSATAMDPESARAAGRALAEMGAEAELVDRLMAILTDVTDADDVSVAVHYLEEYVYLHRNAATIRSAIERVTRIVRALKSYSHLDQQASLSSADIHEGIENTLVLLDHEIGDGIKLTRSYGELPLVSAYVDELNQVWTNLIHNAVQALDGHGEIRIESEPRGGGVAVRIIDDGAGIPDDAFPRIFEPFFTTKAKGEGTGLGLGIVRGIVERHGGTVEATSEPGRTCFEVWLPVAAVTPSSLSELAELADASDA
jgi:signal transduction histidine kinase